MELSLGLMDILGAFIGFVLTLLVFSYIFGDNVLFRATIHIFVGVAAGYALAITIYNIVWPQLMIPLLVGSPQERMVTLVPLVLSLLLLSKISPRLSSLGTPVMAFLVGVGAAAAIGGAVFGTLFPQSLAAMNVFDLQTFIQGEGPSADLSRFGNASIMLVGTVSTLAYFHFGARPKKGAQAEQPLWLQVVAWVGQSFIAVTFGALFAGVYAAALLAMIERWDFVVQFLRSLISI